MNGPAEAGLFLWRDEMGAKRKTNEEFIAEATKVHAGRYRYDKTAYTLSTAKVIVTCKIHGDFEVEASSHTKGSHCAACVREAHKLIVQHTQADFITRAIRSHGSRYDYSLSEYKGHVKQVTVGCRVHGFFKIVAGNHMNGAGCSKCAVNGYNQSKPGTFYILTDGEAVKVGITNRKVARRVTSINTSSGRSFREVSSNYYTDGEVAYRLEKLALAWLRGSYSQVTQRFDGSTECFTGVDVELLAHYLDKYKP